MKRWAMVMPAAVALAVSLLGLLPSPAHAAVNVCVAAKADSPGTFLALSQHPCTYVEAVPRPGVLPVDTPSPGVTPVPLPPVAGMAVDSDNTAVCPQVAFDSPVTFAEGPCVGTSLPALPLPATLGWGDLLPQYPPLPVPVPTLPIPTPPVPLPVPLPPLP